MTSVKMRIMMRAAALRMAKGEDLEAILAAWPALTAEDREKIRAVLAPEKGGDTQ